MNDEIKVLLWQADLDFCPISTKKLGKYSTRRKYFMTVEGENVLLYKTVN